MLQLQVFSNGSSCLFHIFMFLGRGKIIHSLEENKPCHYSREHAPTCHFILEGKKSWKAKHYHKWPNLSTYVSVKGSAKFHKKSSPTFGHWVNQFKEICIPSLSLLSSPEGHWGEGRDCGWSNWFLGHTA